MSAMSIAIVVAMYAVWSVVFPLAKFPLQYSPPVFLTGFRMMLAAVILLGYLFITKRSSFKLDKKQWLSIGFLAFFSIYLANILEYWALQYLSSAKSSFMYSLSPFFAAFFSYLHFGEKINSKKALGLLIGFLGIIPVVTLNTGIEDQMNAFSFFSWPTLAMIGATVSSVYGWVLLRVIVKDQMIPPTMANGGSMLIGALLAFAHSAVTDSWNPIPVAIGSFTPFFGWTLLIALISNIVCYNLYGYLLKKYTATFLSFIGLLSPIFASLHGWIFRGEPLSGLIFLSTGIVCIGLWIVYSAELKQGYIVKTPEAIKDLS